MDLTSEFLKVTNSKQNLLNVVSKIAKEEEGGGSSKSNSASFKSSVILGGKKRPNHSKQEIDVLQMFKKNALNLLQTINNTKQFVLEIRVQYVDIKKYFYNNDNGMVGHSNNSSGLKKMRLLGDKERDAIELELKNRLQNCWQDLVALKKGLIVVSMTLLNSSNNRKDSTEHIEKDLTNTEKREMLEILEQQLKQQIKDKHEIRHLSGMIDHLQLKLEETQQIFEEEQMTLLKSQNENVKDGYLLLSPISKNSFDMRAVPERVESSNLEQMELNSEEQKILEQENLTLQNQLETMTDQAKQLEKQVMEISQMQRFFATKLQEQNETVDLIADLAAKSKTNVDSATEQLQIASKRGVSFRTFVMLFLLVCALVLLYLNAIN